jgi:hypothetical protein
VFLFHEVREVKELRGDRAGVIRTDPGAWGDLSIQNSQRGIAEPYGQIPAILSLPWDDSEYWVGIFLLEVLV